MVSNLKLSILTPSFNHARFIEDTIRSIAEQEYPHFEHIVMDGGSADGTIDILKKYPRLQWVSEKDRGQSNAINKGMALADGDIVAWINSDDYYERNCFLPVMDAFAAHPDADVIYGGITIVDEAKNRRCVVSGDSINHAALIKCPDIIRQPSMFFRKSLYDELGGLREDLTLVFDLDFFLKASGKKPFLYIPKNLSYYRDHASTKSRRLIKRQAVEILRVLIANKSLTAHNAWFCFHRFIEGDPACMAMRGLARAFMRKRAATTESGKENQ
jgi:glycosyltransferase involved in cell wall biosynthesis